MTEPTNFLDNAYELDSSDKTREYYRQWARSYDDELKANGYASPARVAAAMAAHVADLTAPILDLGCGTGLSGQALRDQGFTTIDGTDFSQEMLAVAQSKDLYRATAKGDLNNPIPAAKGDYQNFAAVGVFSPGHAPPEMIPSVVDLLPQHGCLGFTLNDHALEDARYETFISDLAEAGTVEVALKEYGDHLPGIGLKATVYILRKL